MRREIVAQNQTALKRWKPAKCSLHWSTKGKRKDEKSRATNNQYTVPAYWFQIGLKTVGCASALHFQHICVLRGTVSADVDCSSIRCYVLTQIGSLEINKHCCIHPGSQQMFDICFFGCDSLELAGMAPFILNVRDQHLKIAAHSVTTSEMTANLNCWFRDKPTDL